MKLYQFKNKKNYKKVIAVIILIILVTGGLIIRISFANFKEQKSFKVMEGNFIYEGSGDVIFAFYKGDELLTQMPKKNNEENLGFEKAICDKGASVEWNEEKWAPLVVNLTQSKTKCDLYFNNMSSDYNALADLVEKKEGQLIYDGTSDNNLRFIGANPDNYVEFNNEYIWRGYYSNSNDRYKDYNSYEECTRASSYNYNCEQAPAWRIIGVMNNIEDENGNTGSHLKIVRDDIVGLNNQNLKFSWDSSDSSINKGWGINEWSQANLMWFLNVSYYYKDDFLDACSHILSKCANCCPSWESVGLNGEARNMVSKVKWNMGTMPLAVGPTIGTPSQMYKYERSSNTGNGCTGLYDTCNDSVNRKKFWTGFVGLMYPSDYGLSTNGSDGSSSRSICLNTGMGNWNSSNYRDGCAKASWLFNYYSDWFLTPIAESQFGSKVTYLDSSGAVYYSHASTTIGIRPVVYLNSSVKIELDSSANYGTKDNPFRLLI